MTTYGGRVLGIDAGAIEEHASLVDERGILIVVVPNVDRQGRRRREPLGGSDGAVLEQNNTRPRFSDTNLVHSTMVKLSISSQI